VPEVLYRDASLIALDKPSGVSLLADRSGAPCLWDEIRALCAPRKPLLVHRLDKGTSGVLLVALDAERQRTLTRAFNARHVRKFYVARVVGRPELTGTATIDLPLRPGRKSRFRVAGQRADIRRLANGWSLASPQGNGRDALTRVRLLARRHTASVLLCMPATGRTHQLRVHLAWIGHPILGDSLYGEPAAAAQRFARLALHCHRIVIPGLVPAITAPCPRALLN
jgi:tRNA pseudouridine32 synthase/23S rRNA pseudouridine746 synthase/23S rRNA pseudouridine1911/1915/1917 synthase